MNAEDQNPDPPPEERLTHSQRIERLFVEHNAALLRFLTARTGSAQDARDVAQEAYVKLLNLDGQGTIGYLRAYLYSTAANLVKDRVKQRRRREHIDPLLFFTEQEYGASQSPEPNWAAVERVNIIAGAIRELPVVCRTALLLRKFEGLSLDEIAAQLGVTVRSVKRYIARAMEHLEHKLAAAGESSEEWP